jgi:RimJ/RimL family protein N-acetyltransferase
MMEDLDALFAMHSRPDVARFTHWDARSRDEVRAVLEKKTTFDAIRSEGDILALAAVLRATGEVIGDLVLQWLRDETLQGEIGFIVHPDHHGRGYATEAAGPLLLIAFRDLGLHRVVGRVEARNTASARVLEKLGLRREAHLVENEFVKNEWQSELVYAILDREWTGTQA